MNLKRNYAVWKKPAKNTKNMESLIICVWGLKPDQTNLQSYTLEKWFLQMGHIWLKMSIGSSVGWQKYSTPWQVCGFHKYMHLSKLIKLYKCISMDANYSLILTCPLKRTSKHFPNLHESFSVHPGKPTLHLDLTGVVNNICRHFGT